MKLFNQCSQKCPYISSHFIILEMFWATFLSRISHRFILQTKQFLYLDEKILHLLVLPGFCFCLEFNLNEIQFLKRMGENWRQRWSITNNAAVDVYAFIFRRSVINVIK